jgi:hypothetical protein
MAFNNSISTQESKHGIEKYIPRTRSFMATLPFRLTISQSTILSPGAMKTEMITTLWIMTICMLPLHVRGAARGLAFRQRKTPPTAQAMVIIDPEGLSRLSVGGQDRFNDNTHGLRIEEVGSYVDDDELSPNNALVDDDTDRYADDDEVLFTSDDERNPPSPPRSSFATPPATLRPTGAKPSTAPSGAPSTAPSPKKTISPSGIPSESSTNVPHVSPSGAPSSPLPTKFPSSWWGAPTLRVPSYNPSESPTLEPTRAPSRVPSESNVPTTAPTCKCEMFCRNACVCSNEHVSNVLHSAIYLGLECDDVENIASLANGPAENDDSEAREMDVNVVKSSSRGPAVFLAALIIAVPGVLYLQY